ncbi:hypothetical protein ACOSP7_012246 [Xanthoceras sorbifolium]
MAYYSSNYYDYYLGERYQTPYSYGGNYDPSNPSTAHSGHEFSSQNLFRYNFSPYNGAYDPAMNCSVVAYSASTYSEPKSIVYDLYNGGYSPEVVTQFRISYSVSESNYLEFEEYDPTPYDGGYDLAQTYGKPLPHSEAICYPRSTPDSGTPPVKGFSDGSTELPHGKENVNESATKPHIENEKTPAKEEQQQQEVHASSGDQLEECKTNHDQDDKPPESNHGSGYDEGSNYEYDNIVPQVPSGYGLEAVDLCESLFGYWPCLAKYNRRGHDCQQVDDCGESSSYQWKETADYIFGSSYPYEERRAGDVIYSYQRHHQAQPLYMQIFTNRKTLVGGLS